MPFSRERTQLIKEKLRDCIKSGSSNQWEQSFFMNMIERFNRDGEKTRLSTAQYRKLHQLLGLTPETTQTGVSKHSPSHQPPPPKATNVSTRKPRRQTNWRRSVFRTPSPMRALYAPQRAVRRATRQVAAPIILVLVVMSIVGSMFGSSTSDTSGQLRTQRTDQSEYMVVTASRVNQRTGPTTSSTVIGQLTAGVRVRKQGEQGGWTQIVSSLGTGWMSSNYLRSVGNTSAQPDNSRQSGRTLSAAAIRVIDGDTVAIRGQTANVRLVGFNTPEISSPQCQAELNAGRQATARLSGLLQSAQRIEFERVACACRPGTEGTRNCNFGRQCGTLKVDGTDVGSILISENLAVRYICGRTSCPPRPGNWCR